jgi:hypothetical protein
MIPAALVKDGKEEGNTIDAPTMAKMVMTTREDSRVSLKGNLPDRIFPVVLVV